MKLLEQAVRELKGEDLTDDVRAVVNLRVDLKIDASYVPDMNQRLMIYRKVADARTDMELDQILTELRDRYGPLAGDRRAPRAIRTDSDHGGPSWRGIRSIANRQNVIIKFRPDTQGKRLNVERLLKVIGGRGDTTLIPPATIKLDLRAGRSPVGTASDEGRRPGLVRRRPVAGPRPGLRQSTGSSWWTARATAGEVTAGFSKEEILRAPKEDPNAPGGVFARVRGLLAELAEIQ